MKKFIFLFFVSIVLLSTAAFAAEITINLITAEGVGKEIGKVTATDSKYGVILKPDLSGLPSGIHGFHLHENPNCGAAEKDGKMTPGQAAGAHFDPGKTGKHLGPYGEGHLGDLPPLYIGADGKATTEVLAPRLKAKDLVSHSLMIHQGGDNFMDHPEPLGGGAGRIACGVVK
jgi:Cu-Zn family superoxide dismutase